MLYLYRTLTVLFAPFIDPYLLYRRLIGKEDAARYHERQGRPDLARPEGFLVWIHAASVGEAISVLPLMERLLKQYPKHSVMLTTGTVTSAKLLAQRLPKRAFHLFIPVDKLFAVRRFLDKMRPDIAMFVESELWPNLLLETNARKIPMVQLNARMSKRSFKRWQRFPNMIRTMLECFSLSLAQSDEYAERLKTLGAPNVQMLGNLKYDAPNLPADPAAVGELVRLIAGRPLLVAASTHPGEEIVVRDAAHRVQEAFPNLLTIIIPRHESRGGEVARLMGKNVAQRSQNEPISEKTSFYIADTMGELGLFYRLATIVFVGGSLVPHGGQNPLEAARLDSALLAGKYTYNFTPIYNELLQHNACITISDAVDLSETVIRLLQHPEETARMAKTALDLMEGKRGVTDAYFKVLAPYLEKEHVPAA